MLDQRFGLTYGRTLPERLAEETGEYYAPIVGHQPCTRESSESRWFKRHYAGFRVIDRVRKQRWSSLG